MLRDIKAFIEHEYFVSLKLGQVLRYFHGEIRELRSESSAYLSLAYLEAIEPAIYVQVYWLCKYIR